MHPFTPVGDVIPVSTDPQGTVLREVVSAWMALPLPGHPGEARMWRDALLGEGRHQVPLLCAPAHR